VIEARSNPSSPRFMKSSLSIQPSLDTVRV
jgi:hypothetical protein